MENYKQKYITKKQTRNNTYIINHHIQKIKRMPFHMDFSSEQEEYTARIQTFKKEATTIITSLLRMRISEIISY